MTPKRNRSESTRYAEYLRVSSSRQTKENTIETQRAKLREYAKFHPGIRVAELVDNGISGAKDATQRPGLRELIKLVTADEVDEVRVYSIDRLTRAEGMSDQFSIFENLTRAGVTIVEVSGSQTHSIGEDDASGEMRLMMTGLWARAERRKLRQRTVDGRVRAIREGRPASTMLPYGLRHERKRGWYYDESEAEVIRRIFRMATSPAPGQPNGMSLGEIARALTKAEVSCPRVSGAWCETTVGRIVRQTAYAGKLTQKVPLMSEYLDLTVPALVDQATWDAAQRGVAARRNKPRRPTYSVEALLRGLMRCGQCQGAIGVKANQPAKGGDRYRCPRCQGAMSPSVNRLDELVWADLKARIQSKDDLLTEADPSNLNSNTPSIETDLASEEVKLTRLKKLKKRNTERFAAAIHPDEETYYETQAELSAQVRNAESTIVRLRAEIAGRKACEAGLAEGAARLEELRNRVDGLEWADRRDLMVGMLDPACGGCAVLHSDGRVDLRAFIGFVQNVDSGSDNVAGGSPQAYSHSASVGSRYPFVSGIDCTSSTRLRSLEVGACPATM